MIEVYEWESIAGCDALLIGSERVYLQAGREVNQSE